MDNLLKLRIIHRAAILDIVIALLVLLLVVGVGVFVGRRIPKYHS